MFFLGLTLTLYAEQSGNKLINSFGVDSKASIIQAGGNMEGKEVRFGITNSMIFSTITTDAACGAVNNMHDSLTPLAGFVTMINMKLGEIIFGGVGTGLYGIIVFVILTVFVAGLMVGRIPEYLGKKIEIFEIKMAMLSSLVIPILVLALTAVACVFNNSTFNNGAHGFSEILYAFTSASANNGSAFAGLNTNTAFYNYTLAIAMLIGRYVPIVLILAIAGSMANKKILPATSGTFPTHGGTFAMILIAVILIVGALTFFPALALGPLLEHLQMLAFKVF
jgi:K+-transporting ATPase ATPase A chain